MALALYSTQSHRTFAVRFCIEIKAAYVDCKYHQMTIYILNLKFWSIKDIIIRSHKIAVRIVIQQIILTITIICAHLKKNTDKRQPLYYLNNVYRLL